MDSHPLGARRQSQALWSWNLASNRVHFSPAWLRLVGCEEHEIGGTPQAWLDRVHPEDMAQVSGVIDAVLKSGAADFEVRHRLLHKDGSYGWTSCRGVIQRDAAGAALHINASHSDATAEAVADPRTGLPNRELFIDHVSRSIGRARRYPGFHFAVLCVDLGLSPDAGDQLPRMPDLLLPAVARRLETCLRTREVPPTLRNHDIVARLHDDSFAILLDGLKEIGHATVAAERILAELLAPFTLDGRQMCLPASIGVAVSATGYTQAEDVLRDAGTALHRANLMGRGRCEVFDTAVLQSAQAELRLEADFEGAIDRGEFLLFYQPIVSLTSDEVVGFEALVRWQHPVLGLIPPGDFMPVAERTGFIVPLGRWVQREACRQLKTWQDTVPGAAGVWVSVNVSSLQFLHPALIDEIGEALREASLDARSLVLELTEGIALENPDAVKTQLMQLRTLGVRISVDDFGTGYSSLSYLRQLPLDSLKVDRSFVRGIESNKDMASILAAVTSLAQQLGLQVVVEGVEAAEQLALVQSLDCAFVQGNLFSRPVDADAATALLTTGLAPRGLVPGETALVPAPLYVVGTVTDVPRQGRGRRLAWTGAVAALLLLAVSVGVPRLSIEQRDSSPLPASAAGRGADIPLRAAAGDTPGAEAPVPRIEQRSAETRPPGASLAVVHQHRLGSCRGRLVVSADGIAFVPDRQEGDADDGFRLLRGRFLHELDNDSLIIKSSDRAYRFKPAVARGKNDDQLARLVRSMASTHLGRVAP